MKQGPQKYAEQKTQGCSVSMSEGQKIAQQAFTEVSALLVLCAEQCLTSS